MYPNTFTSSAIGPCPDLKYNFLDRYEAVSITWDDGFDFSDDTWFRVFHQCEPPEVIDIIDKLIENHEFYHLILAWDERVLAQCPNAVMLTESACSWLDRKNSALQGFTTKAFDESQEGGKSAAFSKAGQKIVDNYRPKTVQEKEFKASFLTSSKAWAPGHVIRQEIFDTLPNRVGGLDIFKHKSPPIIPDKRDVLEGYQFHIVAENSSHNNYYTEKVVDCFVSKTIPIYWGCPNIGAHFNPDGIFSFRTTEELEGILKNLTPETYFSRQRAVEENFSKALLNVYQWDWIEIHITEAIEKRLRTFSPNSKLEFLSPTAIPDHYRRSRALRARRMTRDNPTGPARLR